MGHSGIFAHRIYFITRESFMPTFYITLVCITTFYFDRTAIKSSSFTLCTSFCTFILIHIILFIVLQTGMHHMKIFMKNILVTSMKRLEIEALALRNQQIFLIKWMKVLSKGTVGIIEIIIGFCKKPALRVFENILILSPQYGNYPIHCQTNGSFSLSVLNYYFHKILIYYCYLIMHINIPTPILPCDCYVCTYLFSDVVNFLCGNFCNKDLKNKVFFQYREIKSRFTRTCKFRC